MSEYTDYRVLAPDSVAWYIQAALVADRTGNEMARDHALAEAQRIAAERRLVEQPAPDGSRVLCYDCRTTGQRLDEIEQRLTMHGIAYREFATKSTERLATIERRQEEDAATFGQHARRLDGIDEELGDQTQRLSALEERVSEVERLLKEMSNREQIDLRQFLGLAKQVDALEVKAASAAVHLGQVPNVVKRINELDHLVQAVIKDCVAIENRLEAQEERLASSEQHQDIMATYDRLALRKRAAGGT